MIKLKLIILFCLGILNLSSQTPFQGGIYSDTEWTLANSPYIITGDVAIFPNITLTVEPGVEIKFDGYYTFEIRGILISIGTSNNRIQYTSNMSSPNKGDWNALRIKDGFGAHANFENCNFLYADYAFLVDCCDGDGSIFFRNCIFDNNDAAIYGYTGYDIEITNCEFTNNNLGVTLSAKIITNSLFYGNEYGIHSGENIDIRNSIFQENGVAIYGGRGLIDSCIIENNNIGIIPIHQGFELRENEIMNNEIGVQVQSYDGEYAVIRNNRICNNSLYNVENLDETNKDLTENCWCISDSALIEDKIYDGYDNIHIGLFNYDIYDDSCDTVLESVIKFDPVGTMQHSSFNAFRIFPNPFSSNLNIRLPHATTDVYTFTIYNIFGQEIESIMLESNNVNLALDYLHSGIYYCVLKSGTGIRNTRKIIKR